LKLDRLLGASIWHSLGTTGAGNINNFRLGLWGKNVLVLPRLSLEDPGYITYVQSSDFSFIPDFVIVQLNVTRSCQIVMLYFLVSVLSYFLITLSCYVIICLCNCTISASQIVKLNVSRAGGYFDSVVVPKKCKVGAIL
jgi:hypothetical protein